MWSIVVGCWRSRNPHMCNLLLSMKVPLPEHELAALLQSGGRRALEYLYDNYSAALFGVLKRICKDHHTTEDLLHDSFTRIWLSRTSYDSSKGTLFTWMLAIARRLGIDLIRSGEYRKQALLDTPP